MKLIKLLTFVFSYLLLSQAYANQTICPPIYDIYTKTRFIAATRVVVPGTWEVQSASLKSVDNRVWTVMLVKKFRYKNADAVIEQAQYELANELVIRKPVLTGSGRLQTCHYSYENDYYTLSAINRAL